MADDDEVAGEDKAIAELKTALLTTARQVCELHPFDTSHLFQNEHVRVEVRPVQLHPLTARIVNLVGGNDG